MSRPHLKTAGCVTVTCLLLAAGCSQTVELSNVSPAAKTALKTAYPEASITEVESEFAWGTKVYEAELKQGDRQIDVKLSFDGEIIEVETKMSMSDVPKAVAEAITEAAKGAEVTGVEKVELMGKIQFGKIVKLDEPKVYYEAEYRKWGIPVQIKVAPDGSRM